MASKINKNRTNTPIHLIQEDLIREKIVAIFIEQQNEMEYASVPTWYEHVNLDDIIEELEDNGESYTRVFLTPRTFNNLINAIVDKIITEILPQ